MSGYLPNKLEAMQFINSLAGAHVLDSQELRQHEAVQQKFGMPVINDVQYENPLLQDLRRSLASAKTKFIDAPAAAAQAVEKGKQYVKSGAEGRDAGRDQIINYMSGGGVPENPTRDFLRYMEQNKK